MCSGIHAHQALECSRLQYLFELFLGRPIIVIIINQRQVRILIGLWTNSKGSTQICEIDSED